MSHTIKSCYKTYYHIFEASNDGLRILLHGKFHRYVYVYLKVTLIPKISKMKQTHNRNQPSSPVDMAVALEEIKCGKKSLQAPRESKVGLGQE